MAQTGLHSIIAAGVSQGLIPSPKRRQLAWGLLLGSVLPDLDILPMAIFYLMTRNPSVVYHIHRAGTHSLTAVLVVFLVFLGISKYKGSKFLILGIGLSFGVLLHIIADIFWWGPVDVLWPLGFWGVKSEVYLLQYHPLSPMAAKLLGAGEFLAYALYFWILLRLSLMKRTNLEFRSKLRNITLLEILFFAIFVILAFTLSRQVFEIVLYAMLIVLFFPLFLYVIIKMKHTIEG